MHNEKSVLCILKNALYRLVLWHLGKGHHILLVLGERGASGIPVCQPITLETLRAALLQIVQFDRRW